MLKRNKLTIKGIIGTILNPQSRSVPETYKKDGSNYFYNILSPVYLSAENQAIVEMYETIPELNAIVNYLLITASTVPLGHFKKLGNNKLKEIKDSSTLKLLQNPNPQQNGDDFNKQNLLYYLLLGNTYINKIRSFGFDPDTYGELWNLPGQHVLIDTYGAISYEPQNLDWRNTKIKSYDVVVDHKKLHFDPDDIIHFKDTSSSFKKGQYLYGNSKIKSAIKALTSLSSIYDTKVTFYQKHGMMGILVDQTDPSFAMSGDDALNVQQQLEERYGLGLGKRTVAVTNKNLRWEQTSSNFASLRTSENALDDYRTLCKVLGFSARLLNDPDAATYNNLPSDLKALYINVIKPLLKDYYKNLSIGLGLTAKNEILLPVWDSVEALQGDQKTEADKDSVNISTILKVKESIKNGTSTIEEGRAILISVGFDENEVSKIITEREFETEIENNENN